MTKDRLIEIIQDPTLLASITYEELKTLALSYPYAHNLRVLLATKSQQEGHPNFKQDLATAAMYSLDRRRLFHLVAPKILAPQPVVVEEKKEEVLQLRPIKQVEEALKAIQPQAETVELVLEQKITVVEQKREVEPLVPPKTIEKTYIPSGPPKRDPNVIFDFSETLRQKHTMRQKEANQFQEDKKRGAHKTSQTTAVGSTKIVEEKLVFNREETSFIAEKAEIEPIVDEFPPSLSVLERLLEEAPMVENEAIVADRLGKVTQTVASAEPKDDKKMQTKRPKKGSRETPTKEKNIETKVSVKDSIENENQKTFGSELKQSEKIEASSVFVPKVQQIVLSPVSFGDWASGFNLPLLEKEESPKQESSTKNFSNLAIGEDEDGIEEEQFDENDVVEQSARYFAQKSVEENQGLVSETLAKLYVRQGHKEKAIAMYERLSFAFPEKNLFFAAEIEKLKI